MSDQVDDRARATTLADGRSLSYQTLGDTEGRPLFFFHGTPGSRLVLSDEDLLAQIPGVQLILPERPGYGLSDPKPERTLLDWPDDVAELADHLGHATFAVSGVSGGGPHALACAYCLPKRVTAALGIASPSPADFKGATKGLALGNKLGLWIGRFAPKLNRWLTLNAAAAFVKDPDRFMDSLIRELPPPDQELLKDSAAREAILRDVREAYRHGGEGHATDGPLTMSSHGWGFDLREITVPVHLWHGEVDTLVPTPMAKHLASQIPGCNARTVSGAGHLLTDLPAVVDEIRDVLTA